MPIRNVRDRLQQKLYRNTTQNEQKAEIIVNTTVGQTESININEIVKQGSIFGPIMCCAPTSKVNNIGQTVQYTYRKIYIECQFT